MANLQKKTKTAPLDARMKQAIVNCYDEFVQLGLPSTYNVLCKVASIFSVSERTIEKIISHRNKGLPLENPKRRTRSRHSVFEDHFIKKEIARQIATYHKQQQYFTLQNLHEKLTEEFEFAASRSTLYKLLKEMGYTYKKVDGRKILQRRRDVVAKQITFLRKYLQHKNGGAPVRFIFLDETWIYQNGNPVRMWVHKTDPEGMPSKVSSEGKRFTLLHAGSCDGFLPSCSYLFSSSNMDKDYHKTMNGDIFLKWVEEQLIPDLRAFPEKCVVIMDNAPYHSVLLDKAPTMSTKKSEMIEWLRHHNIEVESTFTKKELYLQIKSIRDASKKYVTDALLESNGHEVLRLPPYHCEYNPIEMVWGFCKQYYNKHITAKRDCRGEAKVQQLWEEAVLKYTPEMWENSIEHCENLIKNDWSSLMGNYPVEDLPPFIINLEDSDNESDSDFSAEEVDLWDQDA